MTAATQWVARHDEGATCTVASSHVRQYASTRRAGAIWLADGVVRVGAWLFTRVDNDVDARETIPAPKGK